jgi:hypothetical protein
MAFSAKTVVGWWLVPDTIDPTAHRLVTQDMRTDIIQTITGRVVTTTDRRRFFLGPPHPQGTFARRFSWVPRRFTRYPGVFIAFCIGLCVTVWLLWALLWETVGFGDERGIPSGSVADMVLHLISVVIPEPSSCPRVWIPRNARFNRDFRPVRTCRS